MSSSNGDRLLHENPYETACNDCSGQLTTNARNREVVKAFLLVKVELPKLK